MRRWIIPLICALAFHAAFLKLDLVATPPVMAMHENRTITISLVQAPAPAPRKPVRPLPVGAPDAIAPLAKLVPKEKPVAQPVPEPAPMAVSPESAVSQVSQPQPAATEPAAAVSSPDTTTPSAEVQAPGPDHAEVQASFPLYHLNPPPPYPAVARRRNYQGTVLLDVLVDQQGAAARVEVAQSCGFAMLDRSAVKSVRQWRFEPARRAGQPVEMWVQVPVRFELR